MQYGIAIFLAVLQGLTEFIPISSSGHLAAAQHFLGFEEAPVAFDVLLHVGTLLAVLIYYRKDLVGMIGEMFHPGRILRPDFRTENPAKLLILLAIACVPTMLMGLLLKSRIESAFSDLRFVAFGFLLGGFIMITTLFKKTTTRTFADMKITDALIIGTLQGVALFPGVSRSGSTISAALLLGIKPEMAGRFSFLLSIPAILGATMLEMKAMQTQMSNEENILGYLIAGAIAGVVGYFSIRPLIRMLEAARFYYFAVYCWLAGILLLFLL